jgi:inosine-uridine nucleoside N-ribohydrolase
MVLSILEDSSTPVVIHIVGSCRDVAIAGNLRPDLFERKCRAIYLNAGASDPESALEYNVELDPVSYSTIFQLSCPIYWMPCFETLKKNVWGQVGEFCTYYQFEQKEILPYLSETMQKFFTYALGRVMDPKWLYYLEQPKSKGIAEFYSRPRNMWCTGGFLHTAGKTVTREGKITDLQQEGIDPVFTFEPVQIECNAEGYTKWDLTSKETNRYIFKVQDKNRYQQAMTTAMKTLLMTLP